MKKDVSFDNSDLTIISSGVILEGKLKCSGNIRIDGTINGDVKTEGNITIGHTGKVLGEMYGKEITIGGKVEGTVKSTSKVTLETKSILKGDVITKNLVIAAGAIFDGTSKMSTEERTPIKTVTNFNIK